MREIRTYGSVGVPGRQLPGSTRRVFIIILKTQEYPPNTCENPTCSINYFSSATHYHFAFIIHRKYWYVNKTGIAESCGRIYVKNCGHTSP